MLAAVLASQPAWAFEAMVTPPALQPGAPFMLQVTAASSTPEAVLQGRALHFAPCGDGCYSALGVVGLESRAGSHELVVHEGGQTKTLALEVTAGEFKTQTLTLPEKQVTLGPEDQARADQEAVRFKAIWKTVTPAPYWDGPFIMPLDNDFSSEFGVRRVMNGKQKSRHRGVDIRGASGTEIAAPNSGRIVMAADTFYGGNTIVIDHGLGVYTLYMHMLGFNVKEGEYITKGDLIGFVGSTGRSTGPHLHYGLKISAMTADPVAITSIPLNNLPALSSN